MAVIELQAVADDDDESGFNLHAAALDLVQADTFESPQTAAEELALQIPADDLRYIVSRLLPDYVRKVANEQRRGSKTANGSKRWNRAKHLLLNSRVHVAGRWKQLGECTLADVLVIVRQYEDIARFNVAEATNYRTLAKRMHEKKAQIVMQLGENEVQLVFDESFAA